MVDCASEGIGTYSVDSVSGIGSVSIPTGADSFKVGSDNTSYPIYELKTKYSPYQKDYTLAKYYFEEAQRQGSSDAVTNIPLLNLKRGNYEEAQKLLKGSSCNYNLAFAQLMNDETENCIRTLNCCLDQSAEVYYLRAVAYARLGDRENCLKNLQGSVDQEYEYKRKAAVDTEFRAYWNDPDFKLVIKLY